MRAGLLSSTGVPSWDTRLLKMGYAHKRGFHILFTQTHINWLMHDGVVIEQLYNSINHSIDTNQDNTMIFCWLTLSGSNIHKHSSRSINWSPVPASVGGTGVLGTREVHMDLTRNQGKWWWNQLAPHLFQTNKKCIKVYQKISQSHPLEPLLHNNIQQNFIRKCGTSGNMAIYSIYQNC